MSLAYIKETGKSGKLGLWHISESVHELLKRRQFSKEDLAVLNSFTHDNRKKEWLVSRILVEELTGEKKSQLIYDEHSKPFLKDSKKHLSLSHSHNLIAIIIDEQKTGIDIELIQPNVLKIKEKFISMKEWESLGKNNIAEKLTLYWCAKESLYKYYGKKKLIFKEDLMVEPFEYSEKGKLTARIHHETMQKGFELNYETVSAQGEKYMMVYILKEV